MGDIVYRDNAGKQGKPVLLEGSGLVYVELRPQLDATTIRGQAGVPAIVNRGIFQGFTLPVFAGDNQELFGNMCTPGRWDGESDFLIHVYCWLTDPNDTKKFRLQLSWAHYTPGDVVPATNSEDLIVETTTGDVAAFQSYDIEFNATHGALVADDLVAFRLYRLAATGDTIAGNVVINHWGLIFRRDKLGVATP